jgi:hypothetical protein
MFQFNSSIMDCQYHGFFVAGHDLSIGRKGLVLDGLGLIMASLFAFYCIDWLQSAWFFSSKMLPLNLNGWYKRCGN